MQVNQSTKLANVCYEIRGPFLEEAMRLEAAGHRILKLNTGNPAPFGFECPPEILEDMLRSLGDAHGYGDAKGLLSARRAVMQHYQTKGVPFDVEDVYLGNGVSELIQMSMQALLDNGDEVLVPAPDYPLWTASVALAGGTAVHYRCDEQSEWMPDLADIERKVTARTKAIVIINPNNPTGAVYDDEMLRALTEIARRNHLVVCSDEIYDKILYDDATPHLDRRHRARPADLDFQRPVQGVPGGGLSQRLDGGLRSQEACHQLYRGPDDPRQYAAVRQHAGAARDRRRARRPPVDRLAGPARRPAAGPARRRLRGADPDTGRELREAQGRALRVPAAGPVGIQDQRRSADGPRPAACREDHGRARYGVHWPEPDHFRVVTLPHAEDLTPAIHRIGQFLDGYSSTRRALVAVARRGTCRAPAGDRTPLPGHPPEAARDHPPRAAVHAQAAPSGSSWGGGGRLSASAG